MSETSADIKHKAKEAYDPNGNPFTLCPYKDQTHRSDWLDGWDEAEAAYHGELNEMDDYDNEDDY